MANGLPDKIYELGDTFTCACGGTHKLQGFWLAAHWDDALAFTCEGCAQRYNLRRGVVWPRGKRTSKGAGRDA